MADSVSIVQIWRRSEQGLTQPFLCQAEDGCLYWVRGFVSAWLARGMSPRSRGGDWP
jgi:hypothetical protein